MLALPAINTGVFVYQSFILESKDWGPFVIAQSFMAYSVLSVITLFFSGLINPAKGSIKGLFRYSDQLSIRKSFIRL